MNKTKIEWAHRVWNPFTGCVKVSEGCRNCYAEAHAKRFWGPRSFNEVRFHEERLSQPTRIKEPSRIFVNSMGDLFANSIVQSEKYRAALRGVWSMMMLCEQHDFLVLTKYAENMREFVAQQPAHPENIWLGVSVEDQQRADERIPILLETPAAVRWLSVEPLLGPIDIIGRIEPLEDRFSFLHSSDCQSFCDYACGGDETGALDWVVVGGESGPKARPMQPYWVRMIRDECDYTNIPFFFKQWGAYDVQGKRVGKKAAGRVLDGRTRDEFPK